MYKRQAGLLSLVRDIEPDKFKNNVLALGDLAKYFNLPTILTTSFETGPNGPLVPELKAQFPDAPYICLLYTSSVIGRIHSFESCGTVDGPGIRFITFFQGCLMRCLYCHNRDTWDTHGGKEVTVEDLMKEVVTYRHFMNASGGGVTASGGEAILQAEFVRDWFRACKKEGIHTCLDTNGFVRRYDPVIDELLEVTDLVMLDLCLLYTSRCV